MGGWRDAGRLHHWPCLLLRLRFGLRRRIDSRNGAAQFLANFRRRFPRSRHPIRLEAEHSRKPAEHELTSCTLPVFSLGFWTGYATGIVRPGARPLFVTGQRVPEQAMTFHRKSALSQPPHPPFPRPDAARLLQQAVLLLLIYIGDGLTHVPCFS